MIKWILLYLVGTAIFGYRFVKATNTKEFKESMQELQKHKKELVIAISEALKIDKLLEWINKKMGD